MILTVQTKNQHLMNRLDLLIKWMIQWKKILAAAVKEAHAGVHPCNVAGLLSCHISNLARLTYLAKTQSEAFLAGIQRAV